MKRLLISNTRNNKWVEAKEKHHKSQINVEDILGLVHCEHFPQLYMESIESEGQFFWRQAQIVSQMIVLLRKIGINCTIVE